MHLLLSASLTSAQGPLGCLPCTPPPGTNLTQYLSPRTPFWEPTFAINQEKVHSDVHRKQIVFVSPYV